MKDWTNHCISIYISRGVAHRDAQVFAVKHALTEMEKFGCDALLWTRPEVLVDNKMQEWSMSV